MRIARTAITITLELSGRDHLHRVTIPAHDLQHGAEDFGFDIGDAFHFKGEGGDEVHFCVGSERGRERVLLRVLRPLRGLPLYLRKTHSLPRSYQHFGV